MYIYIYITWTFLRSWAPTLSLSSSCAWIPVSPVSSTWAYKPLTQQPLSSCWCRPSHSYTHDHTWTPRAVWDSRGTLQSSSPDSHPYRHTHQQVLPLETPDPIMSLETAGTPLVSRSLRKSHFLLGSHPWRHLFPLGPWTMSPVRWLIWLNFH